MEKGRERKEGRKSERSLREDWGWIQNNQGTKKEKSEEKCIWELLKIYTEQSYLIKEDVLSEHRKAFSLCFKSWNSAFIFLSCDFKSGFHGLLICYNERSVLMLKWRFHSSSSYISPPVFLPLFCLLCNKDIEYKMLPYISYRYQQFCTESIDANIEWSRSVLQLKWRIQSLTIS